jgi:hypothetical protein
MKLNGFSRRLALSGAAACLLIASVPAHAIGQLAMVQLVDRDSGETLPVYRHQGDFWVAGRPGARYAVSVRNSTPGRVLGVVSVDGVNVVSGETASWEQTGYVLSAWQQYDITGWRKSNAEVASFHFTASPASYAARTGRPAHVGVIGVAVFREKVTPPPPPVMVPVPEPLSRRDGAPAETERSSAAATGAAGAAKAAEAPAGAQDSAEFRERDEPVASRRMAPAAPAPRLGTGHGAREGSWVGHTTFERRSVRPDELIRIRYDSRDNLVAMGVIPVMTPPPRPNPFPGAVQPRYAPDPG